MVVNNSNAGRIYRTNMTISNQRHRHGHEMHSGVFWCGVGHFAVAHYVFCSSEGNKSIPNEVRKGGRIHFRSSSGRSVQLSFQSYIITRNKNSTFPLLSLFHTKSFCSRAPFCQSEIRQQRLGFFSPSMREWETVWWVGGRERAGGGCMVLSAEGQKQLSNAGALSKDASLSPPRLESP